MNPQDEERDALAEAYRQASAEDAGPPGAGVRAAILAEAAAAARRRAPAANDSRYLWRGVAGLAVFGFALLIWQQVDHQLPGDVPTVEADRSFDTPPATSAPEILAAPESPAPALPRAPAPASSAVPDSSADFAAANRTEERELQEAPARASAKVSALVDAQTDVLALLRLHFPQQYQSSRPHRLWLVQDGTGARLLSGELAPGVTHSDLRLQIERELGGRLLRPWRIRTLQNAQGQTIEFAIAETP